MYLLSISECTCLGCSQIYGLPPVTFMQKQKLNNDGQQDLNFNQRNAVTKHSKAETTEPTFLLHTSSFTNIVLLIPC